MQNAVRKAPERMRVMVVDDSLVARGMIRNALLSAPEVELVATAANGRLALEVLARQEADIILLDLEMPEMDGLSAIPRIRALSPASRIIISSAFTPEGSERAVQALTAGASDVIQKPTTLGAGFSIEQYGSELLTKVRQLGRVAEPPAPGRASAGLTRPTPLVEVAPTALAVGSSTGGPNALVALFRALPRPLPFPVYVVQHMPPEFTAMLARRIEADCGHRCKEASDGEPAQKGTIYVAPGNQHMVLEGSPSKPVIRLTQDAPENFCRPAVDPLFRSVAGIYGTGLLGLVLTGMGEDGMRGSGEVVRAGGRVFVQDEVTSVVWGMPGAVARAGLAEKILPLDSLATAVVGATTRLAGTAKTREPAQ